ncbi:hypothetical protein DPMN_014333 [Dreissena polymorpha]|uniref:Uncharacterized protein n=1 Tax=Dreissena polymorpha TaxID=45954 RepID=A0A9D4NAK5_DREPO|nr:hypothetical protein DPMN_014333 [Dreissena polymorpha]
MFITKTLKHLRDGALFRALNEKLGNTFEMVHCFALYTRNQQAPSRWCIVSRSTREISRHLRYSALFRALHEKSADTFDIVHCFALYTRNQQAASRIVSRSKRESADTFEMVDCFAL